MITSLNLLKSFPCKGFVKKSASIISDGQYSTLISFFSILSFTKKCLISMCLEFPVQEFLPFLNTRMVLVLPCYSTLSLISCPYFDININNHKLYGVYSLVPTNSAPVELFTFSFYLLLLACRIPRPNDIAPPV